MPNLPSKPFLTLVPAASTTFDRDDLDTLAAKFGAVDAPESSRPAAPRAPQDLDALAAQFGAVDAPEDPTIDPFGNPVPRSFTSSAPQGPNQPAPGRAPLPQAPPQAVAPKRDTMAMLGRAEQFADAVTLGPLRRDIAVTAIKGAIGIPETVVGLADLATGGRVGKALENRGGAIGFDPQQAKSYLDTWYSQRQQDANKAVEDADGVLETAVAALSHPSVIAHSVLESLPTMLAGGAMGRGAALAGKIAPTTAGAIGEGLVTAGQAAESTRQETEDRLLNGRQATLAATAGAATGLIGLFGGALAKKLGIEDIDTMLAAGAADEVAQRGLATQLVLGAVQEGFLEELPQSVSEQVQQNIALERPLMAGVDKAAVLGTLAGALMGGGSQLLQRESSPEVADPVVEAEPVIPVATELAPVASADTPLPETATTPDAAVAPPSVIPSEQRAQLEALGHDPDALTLIDAQEILRGGTQPLPPAVTGVGAIAEPMSPEGRAALGIDYATNPVTRAAVEKMQNAERQEAPPRDVAPDPIPEGVTSSNTPAVVEQAAPEPSEPPAKRKTGAKPSSAYTEVGKNSDGLTLYADARGVRSTVQDGVRSTESVRRVPTRTGGEFAVDRTLQNRTYLTAEEAAALEPAPQPDAAPEPVAEPSSPPVDADLTDEELADKIMAQMEAETALPAAEPQSAAKEPPPATNTTTARITEPTVLPKPAKGWGHQAISVPVRTYAKGRLVKTTPTEAAAQSRDGLAVHKAFKDTASEPDSWNVTHINSGNTAMTGFRSEADAIEAADKLHGVAGVDWTADAEGISKAVKAGGATLGQKVQAIKNSYSNRYASEDAQKVRKPAKSKSRPPFEKAPPSGWTEKDKVPAKVAPTVEEPPQKRGDPVKVGTRVSTPQGMATVQQIADGKAKVVYTNPTRTSGASTWLDVSKLRPYAGPTPQVKPLTGMAPIGATEAPAVDPKRAALAEKRAKAKADIDKAADALKAELRKAGNNLNSGAPLPPRAVVVQTVNLVRAYAKAGIVEVEEGWLSFTEDMGEFAAVARRAFQLAWKSVHGTEPALADLPLSDVPTVAEPTQEKADEPDTVRAADQSALDEQPAEDGGRDDGRRDARPAGEEGGTPSRGDGSERDSSGDAPGSGAGTVASGVGATGRGNDAGSVADYRITDASKVGEGTPGQKLTGNLAAIRILKELETENRPATADEQAQLAKYVGWGGLSEIFKPSHAQFETLQELLTDDEYSDARASTTNAHYTSIPVVRAMWAAVERLGIRSGRVLEPSMGTGNFFGAMPETLQMTRTGVELDVITGRIAQKLYPQASIQVKGFEEARLPEGFFDLVISNVPFGNYPITDPKFRGRPRALSSSIHNYFFAKALDKVRPGGVVAFITSRYTMDGHDSTVRRYLAERATLLGAIRLPRQAFQSNAGTEVVTDVIFLQRNADGKTAETDASWQRSELTRVDGRDVGVNAYFIENPDMVIGTMSLKGSMYSGNELTVDYDGDIESRMRELAKKLPADAVTPATTAAATAPTERIVVPAPDHVKRFAYTEQDGKLFVREGEDLVQVTGLSPDATKRIKAMMGLRDVVRDTMRTMLAEKSTDADVATAQKALNKAYDAFVKKHGFIGTRGNVQAFGLDPDKPLLLSLEEWKSADGPPTKAPIFTKRTLSPRIRPTSADSPKAALLIALNETGRVDWARMAELTGSSEQELQQALAGVVFQSPAGEWLTADDYLSGNVVKKLDEAEAAAAADRTFAPNVEALKAVQPAPLGPTDIEARLGSGWIPNDVLESFFAHITDSRTFRPVYVSHLAKWVVSVQGAGLGKTTAANTAKWGTQRMRADELIQDALDLKSPTVYDRVRDEKGNDKRVVNTKETLNAREKLGAIKEEWKRWLWSDTSRAQRLVDIYNRDYNNVRLRAYDGSHLTLPGMAASITLRAHQLNAIWRVLQAGNTGLGHVVGAGKTFEIIGAAMEMRRLGTARKPMVVVPNHLVEQWGAEFLRMYPAANVLVATKEDFESSNRKLLMARIATGDWDAVVVAHSSFGKVPISDETFEAGIREQLAELEDNLRELAALEQKRSPSVKQLEAAKKRLEAKLAQRRKRDTQDDTMTFEELGVDALFVDEAHLYKNLWFSTKMTRVAGLPSSQSDRADDMHLKVQHVSRISKNRGVVFATGTPVSNTMAELYTMLRYLRPDLLAAYGVKQFDAWAQNFGAQVTSLEISPEGRGFRMRTRFAEFVNLPELLNMFRTAWDIVTAKDVKLPTPKVKGGGAQVNASKPSPNLKKFVDSLVERAEAIRGVNGKKRPDPKEDNMLKVTGEGRAAALDMRLITGIASGKPSQKVLDAVGNIARIYKATNAVRGTQLVFSDIGTPKAKGGKKAATGEFVSDFNLYADIKGRLVAAGIPKEEIAFIHDAKSDAAKLDLFNRVNAGEIRVLLGSTEKMGAGTNVQQRLVGLHHLDAPWRPSDIEQREGRIIRQGNKLYEADPDNFEVEIIRYVTEESFDAYMWQNLEAKAKFIASAMSGDVTQRRAQDVEGGALSYAEIKAIATGNPAIMEKVKTDLEVRRLEMLEAAHESQRFANQTRLSYIPGNIAALKKHIANAEAFIKARAIPDPFTITVDGVRYDERPEADKALAKAWDAATSKNGSEHTIATYAGSPVRVVVNELGHVTTLVGDKGGLTMSVQPSAQSIEYQVKNTPENQIDISRSKIASDEKKQEELQALSAEPFAQADALRALRQKQGELDASLNLDAKGQEAEAGAVAEDTEKATTIEDDRDEPDVAYDMDMGVETAAPTRRRPTMSPETYPLAGRGSSTALDSATAERSSVSMAHPVEFPELVGLIVDLMGQAPTITKTLRRMEARGQFANGKLTLTADMFTPGNEATLAAALAHEIGHLADWLPSMTLKRGNLLGRLKSLESFLRRTYTAADGRTVENAVIRAELKTLSQAWRPWPEEANDTYAAYRESARELYADAISVLLNDPAMLKAEAPTFFREFFSELDAKPDVKDAYRALMELVSGDRANLVARRRERVRGMAEAGDTKGLEVAKAKGEARKQSRQNLKLRLQIEHVNRNAAALKVIDEIEKEGGRVPQDENPRYLLAEREHIGAKVAAFVEEHFEPVKDALDAAGVPWQTFHEGLFYERIIAGDRDKIANPAGISPESARELYATALRELDPPQRRVLRQQMDRFRAGLKAAVQIGFEAGLYTPEQMALMAANPKYATFQVIEHMAEEVTSAVKHQIGTLKDIRHVAEASIVKALVTIRAAEHNRVKRDTFKFFDKYRPGLIETAKGTFDPVTKRQRFSDPKDRTLAKVEYKVAGVTYAKNVDPFMAAAMTKLSVGELGVVLGTLRWMGDYLKPLFTTLNAGFQMVNVLVRDPMRFWFNMPKERKVGVIKMLKLYRQGAPMAWAGVAPKWASSAEGRADLIAAQKMMILDLSSSMNDTNLGEVEDTALDQIFREAGVDRHNRKAGDRTAREKIVEARAAIFQLLSSAAQFGELLSKSAGIKEYQGSGRIEDIAPAERAIIRERLGSPDFKQKGTLTPATNTIAWFSNAFIQGTVTDWDSAFSKDPQTASGRLYKMALVNVAPKLATAALLSAGAAGALGGDDDEEEGFLHGWYRVLRGADEYHLQNYTVVPVGVNEQGESIYFTMPQDDFGRLVSGLAWRTARALQGDTDVMSGLASVLDYMGGQAPSGNPVLGAMVDTVDFVSGRNVRDTFRGRDVFSRDEMLDQDRSRKAMKFLRYQFQQLGGSSVMKLDNPAYAPMEKSGLQQVLDAPVLSNVLGRWIRVSDRGRVQALRKVTTDVQADAATTRLSERERVNAAIGALQKLAPPDRRAAGVREADAIAVDIHPDLTPKERAEKARAIEKKLRLGLARGSADPYVDVLLGATSNAEKTAVIEQARRELSPANFTNWLTRLQNDAIISPAVAARARVPSTKGPR